MAGSFSDAFEVEVLKMITGQATSIITTTPITPYLALFTVAPSDSGGGTEATGGGYARVSAAGKFPAPTSGAGTVSNNATIAFTTFTGSVSSGAAFVAAAVFDASTSGNMLGWCDLADTSKTGGNGDTIQIPASSLTITAG